MKFLSLASKIIRSNAGRLDKPYKLTFLVTYSCQSRCTHCSIWQMKPKEELSLDEIKGFASGNPYFNWIELSGGEPFLRSELVDIAKAFRDSCKDLYLLTMPTNSLCNYDMVMKKTEELASLGIPNLIITVSLDGHRELHDKIRGVPGNYDKAIRIFKGIKELRKKYKNLNCVFGYTVIKQNAGQFEATATSVMKDVPGARFADFHINVGQVSSNYYGNTGSDIMATREAAIQDISFLLIGTRKEIALHPVRAAQRYLENRYMEGMLKFLKEGKSPVANRDGELSVFVDSFGAVFPSIMTTQRLGSIRSDGYDVAKMIQSNKLDSGAQGYYTACEIYQSILGSLFRWD